jgi:hypothetical protein
MEGASFDWDPLKAARNRLKHRVGFGEAATAFEDPRSITIPDVEHSNGEERCILIGLSAAQRLLVVVHVDRGETVRLISARRATWRERLIYEQA